MTRETIPEETSTEPGKRAEDAARTRRSEQTGPGEGQTSARPGTAEKGAGADQQAGTGEDRNRADGPSLSEMIEDRAARSEHDFERRALHMLAEEVAGISDRLRGGSFTSLLDETARFVRGNPGVFIAGAAVAGFALARFTQAGDRNAGATPDQDDRARRAGASRREGHAFEFAARQSIPRDRRGHP